MDVRQTDAGASYDTSPADTTSGDPDACDRVEIEPTKNGGFAVRAFPQRTPKNDFPKPETYAFSSLPELSDFLSQTFGGSAAPADAATDE